MKTARCVENSRFEEGLIVSALAIIHNLRRKLVTDQATTSEA
jgi:hypothetical protein